MNYQKPTKKTIRSLYDYEKVWYVFNMSQKTTIKVKKDENRYKNPQKINESPKSSLHLFKHQLIFQLFCLQKTRWSSQLRLRLA